MIGNADELIKYELKAVTFALYEGCMKEVYWEIKINKPGPRFLPELSLSGPAKVVYFDLPIYFLHVEDIKTQMLGSFTAASPTAV